MKTNLDLWILDKKGKPVRTYDFMKWAVWFEDAGGRQIAKDKVGEVLVSTVFLGTPHPGGMFETMIFGGLHDQHQRRYKTKAEALKGHAEAVVLVKATKTDTYATAE